MEQYFTGIKPTGVLHLGNECGMNISRIINCKIPIMIANGHSLTTNASPTELTYRLTAELLALGCDTTEIYRQSDISETFTLFWALCPLVEDGSARRMHAYKDATSKNQAPSCALYNYPILMAADILISGCNGIFVGQDQVQHIEFTKVLAKRARKEYNMRSLVIPRAIVQDSPVLIGLDGKKMSKSYNNTIPAIATPEEIRKLISKVPTNSQTPEEPKEPETLFEIFQHFATEAEIVTMRDLYSSGISWKSAKEHVIEVLTRHTAGRYEKFVSFSANKEHIEGLWAESAAHLRKRSKNILDEIHGVFN